MTLSVTKSGREVGEVVEGPGVGRGGFSEDGTWGVVDVELTLVAELEFVVVTLVGIVVLGMAIVFVVFPVHIFFPFVVDGLRRRRRLLRPCSSRSISILQKPPLPFSPSFRGTLTKHLLSDRLWRIEFWKNCKNSIQLEFLLILIFYLRQKLILYDTR